MEYHRSTDENKVCSTDVSFRLSVVEKKEPRVLKKEPNENERKSFKGVV